MTSPPADPPQNALPQNAPPQNAAPPDSVTAEFYCPRCEQPVIDPLMCGDCASLICRRCGSPLERIDDLGIG